VIRGDAAKAEDAAPANAITVAITAAGSARPPDRTGATYRSRRPFTICRERQQRPITTTTRTRILPASPLGVWASTRDSHLAQSTTAVNHELEAHAARRTKAMWLIEKVHILAPGAHAHRYRAVSDRRPAVARSEPRRLRR
jgi:hypothetical protein